MQVYYFTSAHHALSNVEKRRVKLSQLGNLNDPFEWAAPAFLKREDRKIMRETRLEMGRRWGLLCFSANWQNPVQWGHYADRHRGLCLGFEVPDVYLSAVTYVNQREQIECLSTLRASGALDEEWMKGMVCTKFSHWACEEEWRVFVNLDPSTQEAGLFFKSFDASLRLNQIIVGAESEVTRAQIDTVLGPLRGEVKCKKARLAFRSFEVCEQLDPARWQ